MYRTDATSSNGTKVRIEGVRKTVLKVSPGTAWILHDTIALFLKEQLRFLGRPAANAPVLTTVRDSLYQHLRGQAELEELPAND